MSLSIGIIGSLAVPAVAYLGYIIVRAARAPFLRDGGKVEPRA